jgi:tetratricopeptide (TPR) repeat protein
MTKSPTREAVSPLVGLWIRLDQPELGDAIALLRKYFGLTRSELLRRMGALSPERDLGVDESLIYRWERGEKGKPRTLPGTHYRALLGRVCDNEVGSLSEIARREFLGKLAAIGGPSMFFSFTGMEVLIGSTHWTASPNAIEQAVVALSTGNAFDMTADHVGQITALYEYLRNRIPGRQLINPVRTHIEFIAQHLRESSLTADSRSALVSALGEASVLAGVLSFWDLHDEGGARSHFQKANDAAREAGDHALWVFSLGFAAELETYIEQPQRALPLNRAAQGGAANVASPHMRSWLASAEAQALARAGSDDVAMHRALENAHKEMARTKSGEPGERWIRFFDPARLEAYEGATLAKAGQGRSALRVLRQAAIDTSPSLKSYHAEIGADTAEALAHEGEIDESCQYLAKAFNLANSLNYRDGLRRVLNVRQQLDQWNNTAAVKDLDERLRFGWVR